MSRHEPSILVTGFSYAAATYTLRFDLVEHPLRPMHTRRKFLEGIKVALLYRISLSDQHEKVN